MSTSDANPAGNLEPEILDVAGAMRVLGVGRNAVYDGCARGEIPHRRVGRFLRFSRSALIRWVAGGA